MANRAWPSVVLGVCLLASCTSGAGDRPPDVAPARVGVAADREAATGPAEGIRAEVGQTIYVPAYSSILTSDSARPFNLAITLSVRNTDRAHPIVIASVRYHDANGRPVRDFLAKPLQLSTLAAKDFFVKESDTSGGTSASFLVEWYAEHAVSAPVVEAIMIGIASSQGISFVSPGRIVAERAR